MAKPESKPKGDKKAEPDAPAPARLRKMRLAELRAEARRRGLDIQYTPKTYRRDYIAAILSPKEEGSRMAARTYTLNHSFARGGKFFTRDNVSEISDLPAADRQALIERGFITEHDAPAKRGGSSTTTNEEG
jgi:hypothetical protein